MTLHETSITSNNQGKGACAAEQLIEVEEHLGDKDHICNCVRNLATLLKKEGSCCLRSRRHADGYSSCSPQQSTAVQPVPWDWHKVAGRRQWRAKDDAGRAHQCLSRHGGL